jgi:aromatic ring-opening dioxygenase catalytic subunit (LigB family)
MHANTNILYISHGAGPMPLLNDEAHRDMVECLHNIASRISRPDAIIVVSAHWEEAVASVTAAPQPELIYDYYGFPEESYEIKYPCVGEPSLAKAIACTLDKQGIAVQLNTQRGFDHGMYVPLKLMYPDADIPCVQLSLLNSLDPEQHIALGEALRELDYDNLLIIGSGFSFHNMRAFFTSEVSETDKKNRSFEDWLVETCSDANLSEAHRRDRLINWAVAPSARFCHPREEHLLPMHVCYGAVGRYSDEVFRMRILGRMSSMYLWSSEVESKPREK